MQLKEFNIEAWENSCRKYDRNHEGLKFDITVDCVDGKLTISLQNISPKYETRIKNLMIFNMQGAIQYMNQVFAPHYALSEEDYKILSKENFEIMQKNTMQYINVLYKEGFDTFLSVVQQQINLLHAKYELSKAIYDDGTWKLGEKQVWNGETWVEEGHPVYSVLCSPIWDLILEQTPCSAKQKETAQAVA